MRMTILSLKGRSDDDARAIGSGKNQFATKSSANRKLPTQPKWRKPGRLTSPLDIAPPLFNFRGGSRRPGCAVVDRFRRCYFLQGAGLRHWYERSSGPSRDRKGA